jgi:hypothetical protein
MKPSDADPKEQAFIETALAAASRAQRLNQARVIVTTGALFGALLWFGFRLPGPELPIEATILVVMGAMLAAVTAKIRSLIQRNTILILQAIAAQRPQAD